MEVYSRYQAHTYCLTKHDRQMLIGGVRKHAFADLRPYVCTFEECDLRVFADRHTWFDHELECHRLEWCCRFCSRPSFVSETELSTHMRHRHAQFSSPTQLPALIKASRQSVDRIPAKACPLCHWDATLRDLNKHAPADEILVVTLEQFRKHLGGHMEQLALFALPRKYKDEEENANSHDSHEAAAVAHSDSQSRQLTTEEMSWKTVSSHRATFDKSIPDVGTNIAPNLDVHSKDLYPWSRQALDLSKCSIEPIPCAGAAVSQICSSEGNLYLHGGKIHDDTNNHDIWTIETKERPTCYPMTTTSTTPSARNAHAGLFVGNTFLIFGGFTQVSEESLEDNNLYLLNTSKAKPALCQLTTDLARHQNLVDSCKSRTTSG